MEEVDVRLDAETILRWWLRDLRKFHGTGRNIAITMAWIRGATFVELGREWNLTPARISEIVKQTLRYMRNDCWDHKLRGYFNT